MDRKEVYISKEDFERIMAQGRKEDIERLFEFEMIKFKEKKIYSSQIKVLNEYVTAYNPNIEEPKKKTKEIKFDFESIKPDKEIETLEELREIVIKYFPDSWFEFKACLSTYCTLSLKNLNGCPTLILVGMPSSEKTTDESFLYGYDLSYNSDEFSPRSFVSHSASIKKEELESVDLLPKLKDKVLITPELAPLFEAPRDKLIESLAILTRVLDGEGYNKDTGAQGHRGYSGDYKFAWLGATTPLRNNFWNVAGKIGNRLFFLNMSEKNRNSEDYLKIFTDDQPYEEKVKICRGAATSFLTNFFKKHNLRSISWDNKQDVFVLKSIINYAELLSKLRGSLVAWKNKEESKEYEHTFPIIEEPPRAINAMINFARGHALINGRDFLNSSDLELVRRICMSSMPYDRYKFLQLLLKHEGRLTTQLIEKELNCSDETARKTMKTFQVLGVVNTKNLSLGEGRPMYYVELKDEFKELFNHTQVENRLENYNQSKNEGVRDNINQDNKQNKQHTQVENRLENPFQSQNNPVSGVDFSNSNIKEVLENE